MAKKEVLKKSTLLRKTIPYIKKEKGLLILTFVLCLLIAGLNAVTPFITKHVLDVLLPNQEYNKIVKYLILYGSLIVLLAFSRYAFQYVNTLTGMRIEKRIREEAIRKINYLPVDYYSLEPDGKIVAKITSDSGGVRVFYTTMFSIINAIINILIVYIAVIIMEPMLGLLILIIVPVILVWITLYRKKVHKYFVDLRETGSRITGKLNELIVGTPIIQDFNQEDAMLDDYNSLTWRYVKNDRKANTLNIYFGWELLSLIKRLAEIGLLLFLGFNSINLGGVTVTIGLISAFVENLDKMINPINAIFNNLNELEDSLVAATRVYMFIDEENDLRIFDGEESPEITGNVEFKNVKFSYVENKQVLNGIDLTVDAGKTIGIVGQTGSGKSTLMNLLLEFNDYDSGHIYVDGNEINKYNKASYRKNLGIVLQTPALFAGTIKSNVTMGRDYPDSMVEDVIHKVGASHLIEKTDKGIYASVSFRGENLSLGEKQLIAFARILLRNPSIVILDEATANIDSDTEEKIKNAMHLISKGRTTFIIAHRLSTIKEADMIVVFENGDIVGKGSHTYLYNNCPTYKDMYDSQYKNLNKQLEG
ncbi:MAG: ABC transporter ATP-binding protein [Acholeplasmatales bacterium]|nr:ABC transporter ATP-binding protein [Acholeplasmatales bacterium]